MTGCQVSCCCSAHDEQPSRKDPFTAKAYDKISKTNISCKSCAQNKHNQRLEAFKQVQRLAQQYCRMHCSSTMSAPSNQRKPPLHAHLLDAVQHISFEGLCQHLQAAPNSVVVVPEICPEVKLLVAAAAAEP